MAKTVKKTTKVAETKATTPVVETKVEAVVEVKEAPVAEAKEEVKKAPAKKAATKKTTVKEEVKAEEPAKKATTTKKVALKTAVTLQFAEKSYTEESLVTIAKDVWKFDLKQKATDLKSVELYVKPEEGLCYYVFNGDVTGSFVI